MSNLFKEKCQEYLDKGYSVIPDGYMRKTPIIKGWSDFCRKKPTTEDILNWGSQFDKTNISVCLGPTSGIVALDLDTVREDVLNIIKPMLPKSPVIKKGAKGETRFFRYIPGITTEKVTFDGECIIEILSEGKKTTIPPSVHPAGMPYTWTSEKTLLDIEAKDLPILPPMLLSHIESTLHTCLGSSVDFSKKNRPVSSGRNNDLSSLCAKLIADKKDLNNAIETLVAFDKEKHSPPLFSDANEYRHTEAFSNALEFYVNHLQSINTKHFRSNSEYEIPLMPGPVDAELKEKVLAGKLQRPESLKKLSSASAITAETPLPKPVGRLRALQEYILSHSPKEQPAFALGAALCTGATILGQRYIYRNTAPNLYTLLLGGSGVGKHEPQIRSHQILMDSFNSSLLGSGSYVSDGSLMDGLQNQATRLDLLDEASGILKTITSSGSDYSGKMADILCNLWSVSNGLFLGRSLAKPSKKIVCSECKEPIDTHNKGRCYRPQVNLIMATTYTGLEEAVTLSALDKGLLGRFLIFTANEKAELNLSKKGMVLDKEIIAHIDKLRQQAIPGNSSYVYKGVAYPVKEIQDDPEAYAEFFKKMTEINVVPLLRPIVSRMYQQFHKAALIHAAFRQESDNIYVERIDMEFAYSLALYNLNQFSNIVNNYLFRTNLEKEYKLTIRTLKDFGGKMLLDDLVYALRPYLKRKRILEIVEEMTISKECKRIVDTDGRHGIKLNLEGDL